MHPDDRILAFRCAYYRAPAQQAEVPPRKISRDHEYIELLTRGGVLHDDGTGKEAYYGPGSLFWHFPGEHTICRYLKGKPYECLVADFKIAPPMRRIAPAVTRCVSLDVQKFTEESLRAFHDDSFDKALLGRNVHSRLLWEAYSSVRISSEQNIPEVLERATRFIEHSFANSSLTVRQLAEELDVSVPHLHMLFRKYLKETPHQRIVARRLLETKNLLAASDATLKELAFDCGFPNVEHFCRLFRQRFSMTPSEFRRRNTPYRDLPRD